MTDELLGKVKQKLIDTKEKWAREGRLLTGEQAKPAARRLPPGQREVKNWPVLDLGVQPNLSTREWSLTVAGNVDKPLTWSWDDLMRQPMVDQTSDMHCVTAWSRFDNRFRGVQMRHLIEQVKPWPGTGFAVLKSFDGYSTNLALADLMDQDVLIATHWEGKPLTREHGGPVRLILPKLYLWKSPKWLKYIWFTDKDAPGFWEVRGYHNRGDPWKEERYG